MHGGKPDVCSGSAAVQANRSAAGNGGVRDRPPRVWRSQPLERAARQDHDRGVFLDRSRTRAAPHANPLDLAASGVADLGEGWWNIEFLQNRVQIAQGRCPPLVGLAPCAGRVSRAHAAVVSPVGPQNERGWTLAIGSPFPDGCSRRDSALPGRRIAVGCSRRRIRVILAAPEEGLVGDRRIITSCVEGRAVQHVRGEWRISTSVARPGRIPARRCTLTPGGSL
jgi:hypothetical protein